MTATLVSYPNAPRHLMVRDFLPAVASYDVIAPTSANFGLSAEYPLRSIEVTSGLIDAAAMVAMVAASGWLAAAFRTGLAPHQLVLSITHPAGASVALAAIAGMSDRQVQRRTPDGQVRELRAEIQRGGGLSRQHIAQLVGVDRRSLSAWASGETIPSSIHLDRLGTLRETVRRLNGLGSPELVVSMRDAPTAGEVAVAIKTGNVDRAVDAVLGSSEEEADSPLATLSPEEWSALVRLARVAAQDQWTSEAPDPRDEIQPEPPSRVRLDRAAYATPLRPRRR
jgi:transcriptional regulator with XRE-family HTH domain